MKKFIKVLGMIVGSVAVIIAVLFGVMFFKMNSITKTAMAKQINAEIDMNQVKDGSYLGSSDGGMVKVEVEVTVENHKITKIDLLKHENGKGQPAEAMLDEMIKANTDDVDVVSGATGSSKTIRNAVNKALQEGMK